jgi:NTP pyrophosphatase (non-canonical NTP hydrolase)
MTLNDWRDDVWRLMEAKGFHVGRGNTRDDVMVRLCLVHTEVSEAVQEVKRHWTGDGSPAVRAAVAEEVADTLIRLLDLCGCLGIDVDAAVAAKHAKNAARPHLYGTPNEGIAHANA